MRLTDQIRVIAPPGGHLEYVQAKVFGPLAVIRESSFYDDARTWRIILVATGHTVVRELKMWRAVKMAEQMKDWEDWLAWGREKAGEGAPPERPPPEFMRKLKHKVETLSGSVTVR